MLPTQPSRRAADHAISFGPFRLLPAQHLLLEGGKPVRLGARALDILIALAERPAELVSKDELIARVWPDTVVEEGTLRVHIAALRRVLGDGQSGSRYIANIPGRGYRFVAAVTAGDGGAAGVGGGAGAPAVSAAPGVSAAPAAPGVSALSGASALSAGDLPSPPTRIVGRAEVVDLLVAQLPRRRFITLTGPGGIGKTTVALAVGEALGASYRDGVRFVDFARLTDPKLVPNALAFALGVAARADNPVPALVALLHDRHMLLLLDNCEHVVDAAAFLAEEVLRGAPGVHILATSREALRAESERVQRLGPLEVPAMSASLTAAEALTYPAIQLFVERATESLDDFALADADAPAVADICRRLDGIALAIELAAGRVDAFGVRGLAARLDDRFRLLTRGRRTALPRHQTLGATLDWSYEFLTEGERTVLRRLAVFAGAFTLEAVKAVVADEVIAAADIDGHVVNLVAKSLVGADVGGAVVYYRLLETTRAYGLGRLVESGESETLARRHSDYFRRLFERAETEWETRPTAEWLAAYIREIDDLRGALDFAFSPKGDAATGVALTIAAVPLWMHLSLNEECRGRVQRALASLGPVMGPGTRQHMQLFSALGAALLYAKGPGPEIHAAWSNTLEIAEHLGDVDYQLRAMWGLWVDRLNNEKLREALTLANRFKELAARSSDAADVLIGDRLTGFVLHLLGDQAEARRKIENMLGAYVAPIHRAHLIRFQFDQRITARLTLVEVLWLQGFADQAMRMAHSNVEDAQALNHELSLCNALGQGACPVALFTGDPAAERYVTALLDHSARHALAVWHTWGRCFDGALRIRRGELIEGISALRAGLDELPETRFAMRYIPFLGDLAEALGRSGEIPKAHGVIDEAIERCERKEELWYIAELLRIKGDILYREGLDLAAAEAHFLKSLDWARRQQVLAWELRTATNLARLQRDQGRRDEARGQLAAVYGRFTEGFGTADLRAAAQILDELTRSGS